jgi:hypothetical protein
VRSGWRRASPSTGGHGYIGSAPELRQALVALSLGGLRRKIEALLLPAEVEIVLQLDGLAERERHRRQA